MQEKNSDKRDPTKQRGKNDDDIKDLEKKFFGLSEGLLMS